MFFYIYVQKCTSDGHSNDSQVLPTSNVLASISGVKDLIAATIPSQRLLFCIYFFEYKLCIFTHTTTNSNGVMSGLFDGQTIGLELPIHSFWNQSLRLNGRGRCHTTGGAQSCRKKSTVILYLLQYYPTAE